MARKFPSLPNRAEMTGLHVGLPTVYHPFDWPISIGLLLSGVTERVSIAAVSWRAIQTTPICLVVYLIHKFQQIYRFSRFEWFLNLSDSSNNSDFYCLSDLLRQLLKALRSRRKRSGTQRDLSLRSVTERSGQNLHPFAMLLCRNK